MLAKQTSEFEKFIERLPFLVSDVLLQIAFTRNFSKSWILILDIFSVFFISLIEKKFGWEHSCIAELNFYKSFQFFLNYILIYLTG